MLGKEELASLNSKPIQFLKLYLNELALGLGLGLGYTCCRSSISLLQCPLSRTKYYEFTGLKPQLITAWELTKLT